MVTPLRRKTEEPKTIDLIDIPEEDLNWSTVSLSEVIQRKGRLEASVYDIEGKHAREVLKQCKWEIKNICGINGIAEAYHRPRFKRIFVGKSDYPIFQPSQINEISPKPDLYISKLTAIDIESLRVKKNQILLTCSGTIGNCTIVGKTLDNCIFSHDLIRITTKNEADTGYLYAFLKTKTGRTLINTNNYGAVIDHIEPEHLENIPIPDPSPIIKHKIHELIMDSFRLRDESNSLIGDAEGLLISELKLPPIDEIKPKYFDGKAALKNFSVKLSKVDNRIEASYHVPIVNAIMSHLDKSAAEVTIIGDSRISQRIILPGRFKRVYVEEGQGAVFFGGKQLLELDPSNKKYLSLTHHNIRIKEELTVKENTILITRSGTIGKVNIAPKHWANWILNEHIIRVVPADDSIAGYIYCWLASDYGYELIRRFTYGSVVDEIDDNHASRIQIPLLKNKKVQNQINNLVLEANQKRYEAYLLEQKAIKTVNDQVIYSSKKNSLYKHNSDLPVAAEDPAQYKNSSDRDSKK
ncbi:MAG: restriction endonuclease subunit S [Nitrospirae bacterium]|nr:restriction endonuclease subunit S [Nitrospirota bacterium]